MKNKESKDKFPCIDRVASLSERGVFYYKPVCLPAVTDENGTIFSGTNSVKKETRRIEERLL